MPLRVVAQLVDGPSGSRSEAWSCLQGGANAGHTIYDSEGKKYALHLVPSGILSKSAQCVVGNGVVVHLPTLFEEIETLEEQGVSTERLIISERAHLLFDLHKACLSLFIITQQHPRNPLSVQSSSELRLLTGPDLGVDGVGSALIRAQVTHRAWSRMYCRECEFVRRCHRAAGD